MRRVGGWEDGEERVKRLSSHTPHTPHTPHPKNWLRKMRLFLDIVVSFDLY
jgi:hypothetical protein